MATQGEVTNNGQEAQAGPTPQETTAGNNTATEIADATEERSKRVYVGNLAWTVSWQDLKDHFRNAGLDVVQATVMTSPDGRSKGCGIVELATVQGAQEAVEILSDTELKGRQIFVREDREQKGAFLNTTALGGHKFSDEPEARNKRVYVGNLSWDVVWQDLKDHMRQAGEVVHAEIITEFSGKSKGCGIVEFADPKAAEEAIRTLTDTELKGRNIFVREDRETLGNGPYGATGRSQLNTSVYVWNLSSETTWQALKDHMRRAGNVDSATILKNGLGESVGCGIVVYQRPQEAARAIRELQNSELDGQLLNIREDRVTHGRNTGRSGRGAGRGRGGGRNSSGAAREANQVVVSNLCPETTWRELKDHFRQCGDVKRAEIVDGGKPNRSGTVAFSRREEAEAAVQMLNGSQLQGRSVDVRLDNLHR